MIAVYVLPTIIASLRHHRSVMAIAVVNILLGWTFVGYLWALIWSLANHGNNTVVINNIIQNNSHNPKR